MGHLCLDTKGRKLLPVMMDEADIKEFEQDLTKDYGTLDAQSPVKIMRQFFDVSTFLAGADLRTNENLQTAVKSCDVLEVPYEIVSAAIVGNPNQTGVYQARLWIVFTRLLRSM